ncbi:hypothetical protein [Streptomyces sp. NRRL S-920]|uniref:hypothetical protein n=1 Tax=Streptomyces sp. NRRL S-920 TaxID=1463921 RepID=UPI0004C61F9E|nr:hypothetical protein [Streptomyces sp. NRRL S-920]
MSYDIALYIDVDTGGPEPKRFWPGGPGNYTSNVTPMWEKALGYPLRDLADKRAGDCVADLKRAAADMTANPQTYEAMNPPNGWGDYSGALMYLRDLRDACIAFPDATVDICC